MQEDGTIYLLGGTAVVSQTLEDELEQKYKVVRLGGSNRFETNLKILSEAGVNNEELLICSAFGYADSISASSTGKPILLVGKTLTEEQKEFISGNNLKKCYIIGGSGVIDYRVETDIRNMGLNCERIGGSNRYETSYKVASEFFPEEHDNIVLAHGDNFPDGLVGGPLGLAVEGPVILVNKYEMKYAAQYVAEANTKRYIVLGGDTLISDDMINGLL